MSGPRLPFLSPSAQSSCLFLVYGSAFLLSPAPCVLTLTSLAEPSLFSIPDQNTLLEIGGARVSKVGATEDLSEAKSSVLLVSELDFVSPEYSSDAASAFLQILAVHFYTSYLSGYS